MSEKEVNTVFERTARSGHIWLHHFTLKEQQVLCKMTRAGLICYFANSGKHEWLMANSFMNISILGLHLIVFPLVYGKSNVFRALL